MHATLRFWLERGVDGFRMDVIHCIGKDPALPDVPAERAIIPACALNDVELTHGLLREIRRVLEAYAGERVMVGEVGVPWTDVMARYYGHGDEVHLAFNFPAIFAPWKADAWREQIERAARELDPRGAWPTWVLSNHDNARHRTRYGSEARARAAAVLLLGLRGTPFLYAGEELGLEDAQVPAARVLDPGGRDGCRAPIPWEAGPTHGWITADAWLPWPPEAQTPQRRRPARGSRVDPAPVSAAARRAARLAGVARGLARAARRARGRAGVGARPGGRSPARARELSATEPAEVAVAGEWRVEVASDGRGEAAPFTGALGPDAALVLRRAFARAELAAR